MLRDEKAMTEAEKNLIRVEIKDLGQSTGVSMSTQDSRTKSHFRSQTFHHVVQTLFQNVLFCDPFNKQSYNKWRMQKNYYQSINFNGAGFCKRIKQLKNPILAKDSAAVSVKLQEPADIVLVEPAERDFWVNRGVAVATSQNDDSKDRIETGKSTEHDDEKEKLGKEIEAAEREEMKEDPEHETQDTADH